ncbi:hypothetical protein K461DRAFT_296693 [Myriangium duriaei CBS 260.36]|uniref:Uncharacterized protein n=1 Tax=Myriangium duriaei CBS 260.36 TaxID=1168546 RepID=A0A9P4IWN9_9PEZI|nr:hypothetical protein K461DRAFT_296693 [Myriangium duriaei CBS 260.36]
MADLTDAHAAHAARTHDAVPPAVDSSRPSTSSISALQDVTERDEQLLSRLEAQQSTDDPIAPARHFARHPTLTDSEQTFSFTFTPASIRRPQQAPQARSHTTDQPTRPAQTAQTPSKTYRPSRPETGVQRLPLPTHHRACGVRSQTEQHAHDDDIVNFAGPLGSIVATPPESDRGNQPDQEATVLPPTLIEEQAQHNILPTAIDLSNNLGSPVIRDPGTIMSASEVEKSIAETARREQAKMQAEIAKQTSLWKPKYEELERHLNASSLETSRLRLVAESLEKELANANSKIKQDRMENQQLSKDIRVGQNTVKQLRATIASQQSALALARSEVQVSESVRAILSQSKIIETTLAALQEGQSAFSTCVDSSTQEMRITVAGFSQQLTGVATNLSNMRNDLPDLRPDLGTMGDTLAELKTSVEELDQRSAVLKVEGSVQTMQDQFPKLFHRLNDLNAAIMQIHQPQISSQLETMMGSITQLLDRKSPSEALSNFDTDGITSKIEGCLKEHMQPIHSFLAATSEYSAQLETCSTSVTSLAGELAGSRAVSDQLRSQITDQQSRITALQDHITDLQCQMRKAKGEADLLSQENQFLKKEKLRYEAELRDAVITKVDAEGMLNKSRLDEVNQYKTWMEELREAVRLESSKKDVQPTDANHERCTAELARLMQQQSRETQAILEEQQGVFANQLHALEKQYPDAEKYKRREIEHVSIQNELRERLAVTQAQCKSVQSQLRSSEQALLDQSRLTEERKELLARIRSLEQELSDAKAHCVAMEQEKNESQRLRDEATHSRDEAAKLTSVLQSEMRELQTKWENSNNQDHAPRQSSSSGLSNPPDSLNGEYSAEALEAYIHVDAPLILQCSTERSSEFVPGTPGTTSRPLVRPNSSSRRTHTRPTTGAVNNGTRASASTHVSSSGLGVDPDDFDDDSEMTNLFENRGGGSQNQSPKNTAGRGNGFGPIFAIPSTSGSSTSPCKRKADAAGIGTQGGLNTPLKAKSLQTSRGGQRLPSSPVRTRSSNRGGKVSGGHSSGSSRKSNETSASGRAKKSKTMQETFDRELGDDGARSKRR